MIAEEQEILDDWQDCCPCFTHTRCRQFNRRVFTIKSEILIVKLPVQQSRAVKRYLLPCVPKKIIISDLHKKRFSAQKNTEDAASLKAEVRRKFITTTVWDQYPRSHHKGATGRVRATVSSTRSLPTLTRHANEGDRMIHRIDRIRPSIVWRTV